jgi:hypothetical protein
MKVTQLNSRTIRVQPDSGIAFNVPYRFFWNGQDRPAESVALTTGPARSRSPAEARGPWEARAFFLFGEIRDRITVDAAGITLHRLWAVKTPGAGQLSIDIEFDAPADLRCLFPGVYATAGLLAGPVSFLGEYTSYPAALLLSMGKKGVLIFSGAAACGGSPAGIGISNVEIQDEPSRLRVEIQFPGEEGPHDDASDEQLIESPGSLDRSHELFLAFSGKDEIHVRGAAAVYNRLVPVAAARKAPGRYVDIASLTDAVRGALATHLVEKGGVAGMRELPGSPWLSAGAGMGLAVAMRKLFPSDNQLRELALRLADFSLKGQLPSGFFHESYHLEAGQWRGVRGHAQQTLLSVGQSSRIAELLLVLAEDLAREGLPHEKYFLAALRFVEFFLDEKAKLSMPGTLHLPGVRTPFEAAVPSLGGLELFFPMARVYLKTGRDRYKKALDLLVKRFSAAPWDAFQLPGSRDGRGPDAAGALLVTKLFVEMRALGYKPAEPPVTGAAAIKARAAESTRLFASILLPWIRVHPLEGEEQRGTSHSGCLVDSFARQRLIFAGHETALLLLELRRLTPEAGLKSLLTGLARLTLDGARTVPPGTAFFRHTRGEGEGTPGADRERLGPVDSRRLAAEILAGLRITEEFAKT